jgi:hypothetical protein
LNKIQSDIKKPNFPVFLVLISIVVIGIIGIPYGDPRFIQYAILLELTYIALSFFIIKNYKKPLYICILLAIIIIIGNSVVSAHIHRILTLSRPVNTIVLIVGGYILQFLLIYTSTWALRTTNKPRSA